MYLMSYPQRADRPMPGYLTFGTVVSPLTYYTLGAMVFMWGLLHLPFIQRLFCSRILLYLGKISFSLWIVHEPFLQIFGRRFLNSMETVTFLQTHGWFIRYVGLFGTWLLVTAAVVIGVDLFWRHVEMPSLWFAN